MASKIRSCMPHCFNNIILTVQIIGGFLLVYGVLVAGLELINWIFKFHTPIVPILIYTGVLLILLILIVVLIGMAINLDTELDYSGGYY